MLSWILINSISALELSQKFIKCIIIGWALSHPLFCCISQYSQYQSLNIAISLNITIGLLLTDIIVILRLDCSSTVSFLQVFFSVIKAIDEEGDGDDDGCVDVGEPI